MGHLLGFMERNKDKVYSKSNSNGSCQKWGAKCHFATLNSVFSPMVGTKMGCHFNNSGKLGFREARVQGSWGFQYQRQGFKKVVHKSIFR